MLLGNIIILLGPRAYGRKVAYKSSGRPFATDALHVVLELIHGRVDDDTTRSQTRSRTKAEPRSPLAGPISRLFQKRS